MSTPISTTVTNNREIARALPWAREGVWIEANATVELPYEPWTALDHYPAKRAMLEYECREGIVSLALTARTPEGTACSIPYNPGVAETFAKHVATKTADITEAMDTSDTKAEETAVPDTKAVAPEVEIPAAAVEDVPEVVETKEHEAVESEQQEQKGDTVSAVDKFNELVADKNWEGALNLFVDTFGSDKITFTTRTISSMKSWDAICAKYNLI